LRLNRLLFVGASWSAFCGTFGTSAGNLNMQEADRRRDTTIDPQVGHELSDLRPGYIALFGIALTTVIVAAAVITSLLIHFKAAEQSRQETPVPRLAGEREATPGPRLQVDANKELRQMRAAEDAALNSYGWVDKS